MHTALWGAVEQRANECNWPESSTLKRAEYKLHAGPSHLPSPISTCHIVCAASPLRMRELSEEANQMESASLGYWKVVCASWTLIALSPPAELAAVGLGDGGGKGKREWEGSGRNPEIIREHSFSRKAASGGRMVWQSSVCCLEELRCGKAAAEVSWAMKRGEWENSRLGKGWNQCSGPRCNFLLE